MALPRVQRVPTMVGYVPPSGWRMVSHRQLADGSYEVTLEPSVLLSEASGAGEDSRPFPFLRRL